MKDKALYGLLSGISLVVMTLIGVALLMPSAESRPSHAEPTLVACAHLRTSVEQGYGVRAPEECSRLN